VPVLLQVTRVVHVNMRMRLTVMCVGVLVLDVIVRVRPVRVRV
jgi:hypothetical protein